MKQAHCSGCGKYVQLDAEGVCPGGHPRSSYRDVRDLAAGPGGGIPAAPPRPIPVAVTSARSSSKHVLILAVAGVCMVGLLIGGFLVVQVIGTFRAATPVAATEASSTAQPAVVTTAGATTAARPAPIRPNADGTYPPAVSRTAAYSRPNAKQQVWALSTCGILTEANGERHDLLGGCDKTSANIQTANQVLAGMWGISSREELLETLTWIEQGGHRMEFDAVTYALASGDPEVLKALEAEAGTDPEIANKVAIARQYGGKLGARSIAGWDYARYVFLCRRGYLVGYLTEDEAWARIMPVARLLQAQFDSWKDLGDNYLIGRKYWSLAQTNQSGAQMREAQTLLLSDPKSPWVQLPWDLALGGGS